ncbi:KR domain-containing protein [Trichoderma breve]|uniref:KR domain-containing protein n=1 Tax=Trichoderma breve TaxID=2034170 RepID=A0A9W9EF34_9HYPO|nr:KR domain-containing protein [Trichoderma breve]KAJ4865548.1 KR domain-containing protein [Trichoderma breve]
MSLVSILPGWWWVVADGRPDIPYVSPARWESGLEAVGFGPRECPFDSEEPSQLNAIMVAKPSVEPVSSAKKTITSATTARAKGERRSCNLSSRAMDYQASCQSQDYAQLVGLSRTIRTEALSNSAVCEADDFEKSLNVALDVFAKFQERQGDGMLDSDSEFAVANGPRRADDRNGKIEIKLHAIDLNFKDALRAVNDIPCPDEGVGTEDAGMIRRVGPGVRTLRPDDPVMTVKAGIFTDATAMTTVFSTVAESMFNAAHLEKGQVIILFTVHRESWASAIQLAKKVGAAMYATVGKGEKVKFLMEGFNIPRSRTYQHHDTGFVEGATRETNGRGIDVALNFLSGELLQAMWRCVAQYSPSVEIGKRDLLGGSKARDGRFPCWSNITHDSSSLSLAVLEMVLMMYILFTGTPKVRYIWNLHEATRETGIKSDFFSSMRGTTGLAGQSNYASANTCLGSYVQYWTGIRLHASHIDQGAAQDPGCVANDEPLLKRRSLANTRGVSEQYSLLYPWVARKVAPSGKKDGRITAYHNASNESDDGSGASRDFLDILLAKAKTKPSMLKPRDAGGTLPIEIGKRLFMFLLKSEDDPDMSTSLAALGLDSLVGVEMRSY